ncbi:MAG: hypothetical protein M3179_10990 [Actinomycetota bacterium]|nr:hypothetical protein [Actinomycetota bacterium]
MVAQDPGVRRRNTIVTAEFRLPYEEVEPGPMGHRLHVVDYDATTRTFYKPAVLPPDGEAPRATTKVILGDPGFHAQSVFGLAMWTLARFEFALGRRVEWGFRAHQLKLVPHAFETANAFYAPESEALLFGYFRRGDEVHFTCLSHDIVVHETTHALLHGLRERFMAPSSSDQAAFHEGFADVVALLSVFSTREVVAGLVDRAATRDAADATPPAGLIAKRWVTPSRLRDSVLFGLADDMDPEISGARVNALRRSVAIEPDPGILDLDEYQEAHRRGEVFVAAVMRAFIDVWTRRLQALGSIQGDYLDRQRVAEEGVDAADQLLTMAIRALDYTPPIHLSFAEFLSAMLTADIEVRDDDSRFELRTTLREWFGRYGIRPASPLESGAWERCDRQLVREGVRFGSLQSDPTEMFRLLWGNRKALKLTPTAYTRVPSVRPCLRIGPEDGLPVRETVAECIQYLAMPAAELSSLGVRKPRAMPDDTEVVLEGGSTLILDEYGMLKYEIHNRVPTPDDEDARDDAQRRVDYLWDQGHYDKGRSLTRRLSNLHRRRALDVGIPRSEVW